MMYYNLIVFRCSAHLKCTETNIIIHIVQIILLYNILFYIHVYFASLSEEVWFSCFNHTY